MNRSHVVITGTGRAGTTFLVNLFTQLGLDTGFKPDHIELDPISRAGLEMNIGNADAPYVVKSPFLCDWAEGVLASPIRIEHAIIPVRRFDAAAASRANVQKLATGNADGSERVWGGLWDVDRADDQAGVLRSKFANLIESLVRHDVPMTFLSYPRLVRDPEYLYQKLRFLLSQIDHQAFRAAFDRVVLPEWVHQFAEEAPSVP